MSVDFTKFGGVPVVQGDGEVVWNFGVLPPAGEDTPAAYGAPPGLHEAFPALQGAWDGRTPVNHHEAVRRALGRDLAAHNQPRGTCFPAGTPVLMGDGTEKSIEDVAVGDEVVTHAGTVRKVLRLIRRPYTGTLYRVKARGAAPLEMTDEHPVLVTRNAQAPYNKGYRPGVRAWVPARDLVVGDRVLVPFGPDLSREHVFDLARHVGRLANNPGTTGAPPQVTDTHVRTFQGRSSVRRFVRLDAAFGRLLGLFLAEGSSDLTSGDGGKVVFTLSSDEELLAAEITSLVESLFGLRSRLDRPKPSTLKVVVNSGIVARFLRDLCGKNAYEKRVPAGVFSAPRIVRLAVLRGWLDGDGDLKPAKAQVRGVSASAALVRGMRRLSLSCGLHAAVSVRKKEAHQRAASRDLYLYGEDAATVMPDRPMRAAGNGRGRMAFRTDEGFLCPVRSIEAEEVTDLPVYNLEVEEEHTYVAGGIAVHNCGGRAAARALEILQCVLIVAGKRAKYHDVSHAWPYYLARRDGGMLGGGDGVPGGSIPPVLEKYGALHRAEAGDPSQAGPGSDDVAVRWGAGQLSSQDFQRLRDLAKDNLVTARVRARSAQELADGLASGGVAVCSDLQGYTTVRDSDGFCSPQGRWAHYHVRSGIVLTDSGRKGFAYDQSWGDDTPSGPPLPGYPGNCFGVDWDVQDSLCRSGAVDVLLGFDLWDLEKGPVLLPWVF